MVCIGSSCGRSALHSKGCEGAGRRAPISKPPWRRRLARSIVCGCISSRSIEGRKGKGEVVVGVLRVHGGEEGLVLELVRVAGAAAAAAVAGPAVASHSPWPWQTPLLAHLPAKPWLLFLSLSSRLSPQLWVGGGVVG